MLKKTISLISSTALLATGLVMAPVALPAFAAPASGLSPSPAELLSLPLTAGANQDVATVMIDFDPIGGTSTYNCHLASGSLPAGLSLNTTSCAVSGETTTLGTSTFTLEVLDTQANFAVDATLTYTVAVEAYSLQNSVLRFGSGTNHSISPSGMLQQPWYLSPTDSTTWYPLIYDDPNGYSVDAGLGIGTGGTAWHGNTSVFDLTDALEETTLGQDLTISGWKVNTSGFTVVTTASGVKIGYGTLVSETTFKTASGEQFVLNNTFSLGQNDGFVKALTSIKNLTGTTWNNVNLWVGTRDDYVGNDDDPTNTKGNFVNGDFAAITSQSDEAKVVMTTSASEGSFFYATAAGANTIIDDCCSFRDLFPVNPVASPISDDADDSSYGFVLNIGSIATGATSLQTEWYFGGGSVANLGSVSRGISVESGAVVPVVAAEPYFGPRVTGATVFGNSVALRGSVLSTVSKIEIQGRSVPFVIESDGKITFQLPGGLKAGIYDVVFTSSYGLLTAQDLLTLGTDVAGVSGEVSFKPWTVRLGDSGLAKIYAKSPAGAGKIQFFLNGKEIAWVKAKTAADPKLRNANGASYLVRTVTLAAGKNVLEIYVDGVRTTRVAYTK